LTAPPVGPADRVRRLLVEPVLSLAGHTIDVCVVVTGAVLPGTAISDRVAGAHRRHLFGSRTLQDLSDDADGPRFVFNATNIQAGSLWRFERPYLGDYRVGLWNRPAVPLAKIVAASLAFPSVLSRARWRSPPRWIPTASPIIGWRNVYGLSLRRAMRIPVVARSSVTMGVCQSGRRPLCGGFVPGTRNGSEANT
jgi:hypothetical protein